jgi:alkylation response protein AidB-like acyl-CoA dehydrogenase
MRFDLDEQQRAFQEAVTDYLQQTCSVSRVLEPHDTGKPVYEAWQGLMEMGLGGTMVPEAHGGLGLGLLELAVIAEVVGRFAMPGPFMEHALATLAIALGGSDAQKARWLPVLASGEKRATIALAEAGGGWSPDAWTFPSSETLKGDKRFVLHAQAADLLVVGLQHGAMALVEGGAAGIDITAVPSTDAGRQLAHVKFSDTPCELLPVDVGGRIFDAAAVLLAADAFGGASRCLAMSVTYSKERVQFGQPIGAFQAVKHQLAQMAVQVEPSVGLYWYAAHVFDADPEQAPEAAALAKSHITELYPRIARHMIEAHGGIGYTWEFGAHVWLKRALFNQAYLGMPHVHRARVAAMSGWGA